MAADLPKICKEVAEGILYDLRQPLTASALLELEKEGTQKDSPLTGYPEWRKALDQLLKEVGIVRDKVHGLTAPGGLKPDGVLQLSLKQMKALATFGSPENAAGRKSVQSSQANLFLGTFHKNYAPLFMEVVYDNALSSAAQKMTTLWQRHVVALAEMGKDSKYSFHKPFIDGMNLLAQDPRFGWSIANGSARPEHYCIAPEQFALAITGQHPSSSAVSQLGTVFMSIANTASSQGNSRYEKQMRTMQQEFFRDVKPALEEFISVNAKMEEIRAMQAASAQYRAYT